MSTQYREWLLELIIEYGTGNAIKDKLLNWTLLSKAAEMEHIVAMDDDEFRTIAYVITPKASKYLERYK